MGFNSGFKVLNLQTVTNETKYQQDTTWKTEKWKPSRPVQACNGTVLPYCLQNFQQSHAPQVTTGRTFVFGLSIRILVTKRERIMRFSALILLRFSDITRMLKTDRFKVKLSLSKPWRRMGEGGTAPFIPNVGAR